MERFTRLETKAITLPHANIDTDQLIPARFLKHPRSDGYGRFLLHDLRWDASGSPRDNPIDQPALAGAALLIARRNFGCGSSREGAVYALADFGVRCVAAPSFGDIFASNAVKNGLLPARVSEADAEALLTSPVLAGGGRAHVDLPEQTIVAGNFVVSFADRSGLEDPAPQRLGRRRSYPGGAGRYRPLPRRRRLSASMGDAAGGRSDVEAFTAPRHSTLADLPGRAQRRSKAQTSSKPIRALNFLKLYSGRSGDTLVPLRLEDLQRLFCRRRRSEARDRREDRQRVAELPPAPPSIGSASCRHRPCWPSSACGCARRLRAFPLRSRALRGTRCRRQPRRRRARGEPRPRTRQSAARRCGR